MGMTETSLQGCLPQLADILAVKTATLYERQRALVREGLLESVAGRGRGSGVRATDETIATLFISMLASVSLSEVGVLARSFLKAAPLNKVCTLTGAKTFHGAVARVLSDKAISKRATGISVQVNAGTAAIGFDGGDAERDIPLAMLTASFAKSGNKTLKWSPAPSSSVFITQKGQPAVLRISVSIAKDTLDRLTDAVVAILSNEGATS